ncbi:XRE family transcriptional regulator [Clostridium neuense]|uniref:XRE family transcriptional regulator n=1 Tax=Clostridium neuense TaxID=1728934 RepID=A0ABW8THI9_9CLOT
MEKCVVLSDGDKLREIRKKYHVKQEEIAGEEITRNLISEIENNKAPITKKTAEIIIKNLSVLAKKRYFEVDETVDYLMENQIVQANRALDNYIEELNTLSISKGDSFIKTLKEAESFLIDWDIKDKKLKIYEIAGDYYCNNNEMYKSAVYYEKASALLSRMFLDRKLLSLSRKLSTVYGRIGDYKKSIECCEFALKYFDDMPQKDEVVFLYNNALNYKHINNLKLALKNIEVAENLVSKTDILTYIKVLNTKGNCLYEMKSYDEAIKIFNKIFTLIDKRETDKYLINLINIVNSYWYAGMKDKALENFKFVINELPNLSNKDLCVADIYFEVGKIYERINKIKLSEDYYLMAVDFSEKQKNYVLLNSILYDLIELYSISNNVKKINNIKDKVLLNAKLQNKINNLLMYKLIAFYIKNNDDIAKQVADFAIKFE